MSDSINYPEVGARIRQQREHIGLTQEQLGEACDLSASFVGHIERGSRILSVESLYKLASVPASGNLPSYGNLLSAEGQR